jgi:hypothetical protein
VRDGISVLADRGRRISLADVARLAVKMGRDYLIVDGVHVPAVTFGRKTGGQRAFHCGKHKRHGLNVQTACCPDGELLRAAAPLPGATAGVTAARKAGIAAMLTCLIGVVADLGYPQELGYVLRDHLRQQQPAPPGQFPDPVAGALHRPVRGPAGQEQHPRAP